MGWGVWQTDKVSLLGTFISILRMFKVKRKKIYDHYVDFHISLSPNFFLVIIMPTFMLKCRLLWVKMSTALSKCRFLCVNKKKNVDCRHYDCRHFDCRHSDGYTFFQNVSALALTVWEKQCLEDHWLNELPNYLVSDKDKCKTTLTTPGLLITMPLILFWLCL